MALVEAQIQAIKLNADRAANGDRVAQDFFRELRAGNQSFQREMLEYAEEYMKEKNIIFSEPLVGVNLLPVQIESARKTLTRLKNEPGNPDASNFWAALERNAGTGDICALEYLKARTQILASMEKEASTPKPDWFSGEPKTNPASPQAQVQVQVQAPVMGQPAASQMPGQHVPGILSELAQCKAYRDEIQVMRDEILKARDQILGAIRTSAPVVGSSNGTEVATG